MRIDEHILAFLSRLFDVPNDIELRRLVANWKIEGGLELMLPGMYYDIMKAY